MCIRDRSLSVITLEVTTTEQEKITVSENEWSFFTMNEEEITYPVSYTHLDVYKRQKVYGSGMDGKYTTICGM